MVPAAIDGMDSECDESAIGDWTGGKVKPADERLYVLMKLRDRMNDSSNYPIHAGCTVEEWRPTLRVVHIVQLIETAAITISHVGRLRCVIEVANFFEFAQTLINVRQDVFV